MSDVLHHLGERMRTLRKAAHWTQEKLAEQAALSPYYIGQIERGESSPSLTVLQEIARALGVKLSELFSFPSEQETPAEIVEDIVMKLRAGDVPDVKGLSLIRELIKRLTVEKDKS